jgi:hypothetical protein
VIALAHCQLQAVISTGHSPATTRAFTCCLKRHKQLHSLGHSKRFNRSTRTRLFTAAKALAGFTPSEQAFHRNKQLQEHSIRIRSRHSNCFCHLTDKAIALALSIRLIALAPSTRIARSIPSSRIRLPQVLELLDPSTGTNNRIHLQPVTQPLRNHEFIDNSGLFQPHS